MLRSLYGVVIGTALVGLSSPLFVRSYVPRESHRGVWTLAPGSDYRWRSEGYATTAIGPWGMPGKTALSQGENLRRIALYGDSQAEGVCVADEDKLFAAIERAAGGRIECLPLAQSGDDVDDWTRQMPWAESVAGVDEHVLLVVELSDLRGDGIVDPRPSAWSDSSTRWLPAFAIETIRRVLTTADGTPRRLRWRVGPAADDVETGAPETADRDTPPSAPSDRWPALKRLAELADRPITILYAPLIPSITGGDASWTDDQARQFESLRVAATGWDIDVVDARDALVGAAKAGRWPHGFHNGQFGVGHLNATGNEVVAGSFSEAP